MYKYKFSKLIFTLLIVIGALSIVGITGNVISLFKNNDSFFEVFIPILSAVLEAFVGAIAVYALIKARYYFYNGTLYFKLGFFVSKLPVLDITSISLFKEKKSLVVYYGDKKYMLIVISELDFDDFTNELLKLNPSITYSIETND
jgi:hypothetical protein